MKRLSWFELACLPDGARVVFAEPHDIFPECVIPAGAAATVEENGLNEIWCALLVRPDDKQLQDKLSEWKGCVRFGGHLDPGADQEDRENAETKRWHEESPLMGTAFEGFQATRKWSDDLAAATQSDNWAPSGKPKGWLYFDALYIEQVQDDWPAEARARGKWHLLIGRDDWITDDLTELERRLYRFAIAEGYGADPATG